MSSFFGLGLEYKPVLHKQIFEMIYHSQGAFTHSEVYELPITLRMFYYKNVRFLNKIFDPILNFLINCFGKIVNLILIPTVSKQNLMKSNSKSVL